MSHDITDGDWDDSDVAATPEELAENSVGFIAGPSINADGKKGLFVFTDTKVEKPRVSGVIIGKFPTQLLFGGENSANFSDYEGWICRNDHKDKSKPRVNENAPTRILRRLADIGGGVSCGPCPLRKFGENDERPDCGARWALLWLDDDADEAVPLFIKGTSITPMHEYLKGDAFNIRGSIMPHCYRRTELSFEKDGKGVKAFNRVVFRPLGKVATRELFEQYRRDGLDQLKAAVQRALGAARPNLLALTAGPAQAPQRHVSEDVDAFNSQVVDDGFEEVPLDDGNGGYF